jgi:SAM-dependent methyltransferase/uncharacterized protein YbaR (Trm112 family)
VRLRHFEALRPVCPVCRGETAHTLRVTAVDRGGGDDVLEGTLGCPNPACLREYPVIDGVPVIVPAIRAYVEQQGHAIWMRDDLGETAESLLGDCAPPGSAAEAFRHQLGSYTWDHYAEFDPAEPRDSNPEPGGVARLLARGLEGLGPLPDGPVLETGCSVGRGSFELAERTGRLVLGVDLNFAMLRLAQAVLQTGRVRYARRRVGLVYDRREFDVPFRRDLVDFWACDAAALPLTDCTFAVAVSLNLLDAIPDPLGHLTDLARVLIPGGRAVIASPYDWSASATAVEGWLGGHSQRGPGGGASEPLVRALLTPGAHPGSLGNLRVAGEVDGFPWHVRLHDRAVMQYRAHMLIAEKVGPADCTV